MIDPQLLERFKRFQKKTNKYWDFKLEEVEFEYPLIKNIYESFTKGKTPKYADKNTDIQVIKSGQAKGYYNNFDFAKPQYLQADSYSADDKKNLISGDLLINTTGKGTAGRVTLFDLKGKYVADSHIGILRFDKSKFSPFYILNFFINFGFSKLESLAEGSGGQVELPRVVIEQFKIPIPKTQNEIYTSLKIQEVLVEFVECFQDGTNSKLGVIKHISDKIAEAESLVLPLFFSKHPSVKKRFNAFCREKKFDLKLEDLRFEHKKLHQLALITMGQSPEGSEISDTEKGLPFHQGKTGFGNKYIKEPNSWTDAAKKIAEKDDILISMRAPAGVVNIASYKTAIGRGLASIRSNADASMMYIYYFLKNNEHKIDAEGENGGFFTSINRDYLVDFEIVLPQQLDNFTSLQLQQIIIEFIDFYLKKMNFKRRVADGFRRVFTEYTEIIIQKTFKNDKTI